MANKQMAIKTQMDLARLATARVSTTSGGSSRTVPVPASVLKAQGKGTGGKELKPKELSEFVDYSQGIEQLKDMRKTLIPEMGKLGYSGSATVGKLWGSKASVARSRIGAVTAQLRKVIGGEAGVMTDQDFQRYEAMMPTLLDTAKAADIKLQLIVRDMERKY
jgi:hypothetical protein